MGFAIAAASAGLERADVGMDSLHRYLRKAWPLFRQRYGEDFHLATPLSLEMQAFLDATKLP